MADWPHAPVHRLGEGGAYMITGATYQKERLFCTPQRLRFLHSALLAAAERYGLHPQAWAVFSNHYHVILIAEDCGAAIRDAIDELCNTC